MTSFALASFSCQFVQSFPRFAIMLEACLQMRVIAILFQFRQNSLERGLGVADQSIIELGATTKLFSANVDLDNSRVPGKKLLIREIGADHEQSVAVHHREVTGGKSEQAGHAD